MKFLIVNAFHRDDKGDAALVHVLMDQLRSIDSRAEINICSMEDPIVYPSFYQGKNIGSFEYYSSSHAHSFPMHLFVKIYLFFSLAIIGITHGKFSWLLPRDTKRVYNHCASADLIVSVGGGYFLTNRGLASRMHLLFALQTLWLGKKLGRKVVTAPVSVGPFSRHLEARITAWALKKIDLVLLREAVSQQFFIEKNGNVPPNLKLAGDGGFAFAPSGSFDVRKMAGIKTEEDEVLILAVRNWQKSNQAAYEQAHADLLDHLHETYPHIRPLFLAQCTFPHLDDDDRKVAERIFDLSKTKNAMVIKENIDYKKIKLAYEHADAVIATRFHAMVFALSYAVPGIAIEYEHKTRGIMRSLNLEKWTVPINAITSEKLITLFDTLWKDKDAYKKYLIETMPDYIDKTNSETLSFFERILMK
jgi:colanic acid/amylovoran biosynthesis protein